MSQPFSSQETTHSDYSTPASDHTGEQGKSKEMAEKARRTVEHARDRVEETLDRAKRQASDTYYRARSEASRAYDDGMDTVRSSFQEHPLAYAFGAFAAGVLIGMLLPTSKAERRAFSSSSERIRRAGEDLAARGRDTVTAATRAAEEKIRGTQSEDNPGASI